jgi:tryptophan synthase alpha chain
LNRLRARMAALARAGDRALVAYLTHGDPSPAATVEILLAAAEAGADVLELGVPFSDPSADGVVIQRAMQRALAAGGGLEPALDNVRALRAAGCEVPVVLFGYYNPIFVRGVDRFAAEAAAAGVDAVLVVDVPVGEAGELHAPLAARGLDVIPLVAPTSTRERIEKVRTLDPPFVYYISMTGVTGAAFRGAAGGADRVREIRELTGAPVCVGFGIKTADDARRTAEVADGVVVGSALVERVEAAASGSAAAASVGSLVRELRSALGG